MKDVNDALRSVSEALGKSFVNVLRGDHILDVINLTICRKETQVSRLVYLEHLAYLSKLVIFISLRVGIFVSG